MKKYMNKILERFMNISFQKKFLIVTIIPAVLALFIQGIILFQVSAKIIYDESIKTNQWLMDDLTVNIHRFFRNLEDRMVSIYRYTDEIHMLSRGDISNFDISIFTQKLYLQQFGFGDYIRGIYIYTDKGELASSYTPVKDLQYPSDILKQQPHLFDTFMESLEKNNDNTFICSYYNEELDKNIIRMVHKIKNIYTGENYGLMIIDFDDTALLKIIDKYMKYENQIFWLEREGNVIFTTSIDGVNNSNNNEMMLESNIQKFNIDIMTKFPLDAIEYALVNTRTIMILLMFILISIIIILSYFLSNTITRPINQIVKTMKIVESGKTSVRTDMKYDDELGKLGHSLNTMLDKLDDLMLKERTAMYYKNIAELKALQAQVNPHFLYNTLQTMSSIAQAEQSHKVSTMCNIMADLFRYSIKSGSDYATIKEELTHLKKYVYLQNARFNNAIRLRVYCDFDMYNIKIPRLSLQPLVENAIIHGLKGKGGKGSIRVSVRKKNGNACIYVMDNGSGIDDNELEILNNRMKADKNGLLEQPNHSMGLDNINQRLKNIYGNQYRLRIYSKKDRVTVVSFSVPIQNGN